MRWRRKAQKFKVMLGRIVSLRPAWLESPGDIYIRSVLPLPTAPPPKKTHTYMRLDISREKQKKLSSGMCIIQRDTNNSEKRQVGLMGEARVDAEF